MVPGGSSLVTSSHAAPRTRGDGKRRERSEDGGDGLPPGDTRIASPYDTDARWGTKRDMFWLGYKLHVTETCTAPGDQTTVPGTSAPPPNLITNVATTHAAVPDTAMTTPIHQALDRRALLPGEHYLDSGYPSAALLVKAADTYGIALVTPLLADTSPQALARGGYQADAFTVDFDKQQVTCPQGQTSTSWNSCTQRGTEMIVAAFPVSVCRPCPARARCTTSKLGRRMLSIHPREIHEARRAARAAQDTTAWQAKYALRAGVEGTIRQAVTVTGIRRARYRGLAKTRAEHVNSAVALNLIRLNAWWNGHPLDRGRTSHLARLQLSLAA